MSPKDDSWAHRRRRLTKCKKHGLHFDSELTSGCALCRKEGLIVNPQRTGPQFLLLLIVLLGLALLVASFVTDLREGRETKAKAEKNVVTTAKLDPDPYRSQIQALERALNETPDSKLSSLGIDIRSAAQGLVGRMARQDSEIARQTARTLGDWASTIPEDSFAPDDLRQARDTWKRISGRAFKSTSWWSPATTRPKDDRKVSLLAYREAADNLVALVDEGAAQVLAFADPVEQENGDSWASFAEDWRRRIDEVGQGLPHQAEFRRDASFLAGVQALRNALSALDRLAADRSLPTKTDADARLDQVTDQAELARATFDSLLLG